MRNHIHCQVAGAYARSDSHFAGVKGSANAMQIIAAFGEPWQLCTSITATFTDANGENPNVIALVGGETQYSNKIDDMTYLFAVPQSAAAVAGKIQLVFDGYIPQGTAQTVNEDADVVADVVTEFLDTGSGTVALTGPVRLRAAEVYTIADAQETITDEWGSVTATEVEKLIAQLSEVVGDAATILELNAHPPKIENGYWYLWDAATGAYQQSGKAQGEKGDKGADGSSAAAGSVGFDQLDAATKMASGMYYQVSYLSMGTKATAEGTRVLKFYATAVKGEVITSDTQQAYFKAALDAGAATEQTQIRAVQDVVVKIGAQVKLRLGTDEIAATGGQRALHIYRKKSGETESEELINATIQDWSKTKGKPYSISAPPRIVKLSAGDLIWMNVYMKKNDSIDAEQTWLLMETVRPTNWASS